MTNPIDEFKCRKCGGEIFYDERYDGIFNGSKVSLYWCGHCENCDQRYKWCEVYNLESIENFEAEDDDD